MSDRDALVSAICDQPDEDTPRLIFADYLDERDEPAHAAFIRAQVELARTAPWEPFAVRCKWREPSVLSGEAFRPTLPKLSSAVEWASVPFRRGFGWWIDVLMASEWDARIAPLFDRAPIGKVTLRGALLDDWRRVAESDRLSRLRAIVFATSPIEPLFAIRDATGVERVTDLHFNRASGAGMPEVIEDLFRSYLGRVVRGLHFHMGYESRDALLDALNTGPSLERLSFSVMGLAADSLRRLFDGPIANKLAELHFVNEPLSDDGLRVLAGTLPHGLRDLTLISVGMRPDGLEAFARSDRLTNLCRMTLHGNALTPRAVKVLSLTHSLTALRAIDLSGCHIGDKGVRHVTQAKWWENLVEVVLRRNSLSHIGVKHLLNAPVPPDLTALVLDRDSLSPESRAALVKKFGAAVVFVVPDPFG